MNRKYTVPFNPSAVPGGAAPLYKQMPARVPKHFMEAMKRVPVKATDSSTFSTSPVQKTPVKPFASKWKSSFKPMGEEDDTTEENVSSSSKQVELYDPYDPGLSDSEIEAAQGKGGTQCPSDQDHYQHHNHDSNLGRQHLSTKRKSRWDIAASAQRNQLFDLKPETRPSENQGLSPGHRLPTQQAYSPLSETLDRMGFGTTGQTLNPSVCSPERICHGSSTQGFPACYGGQMTNGEERIMLPEHRREMTTTVRLSPPRLHQNNKHQLGNMEKAGQDQITTDTVVTKHKTIVMDKNPITCDLCDVEVANGQELEEHLDSKTHWRTLEHIQQNNNYDDLAVAFLQEVMMYKSRQCSRPIEDSALLALQENDHMTKVEMFHCAACNVFVSTSASSVQTHITSQQHLSNTKEFEIQQRRNCLDKAGIIMEELRPQFEHFIKGDSSFKWHQ